MPLPRVIAFGLSVAALASVGCLEAAPSQAEWPQWLGPTRDGHYHGAALSTNWPKDGPPIAWKRKVGQGFSGPVVADDRLILFHRIANQEVIECLDAASGEPVWKFEYPTRYVDDFGFDEGPRATPLMARGRVWAFGAEGQLHCLDAASGTSLWAVDTKKDFSAGKGFFGMACSPLLEGEAVMVNIGGPRSAGIVAFHTESGKLLWRATDAEASYASPTAAVIDGRRHAFFFNREGLVALDPSDGKVFFEFPWRPAMQASVNAATPLVVGDRIFISTSYGRGAALLRFAESGPTTVWAADDVLSNHYATSVHDEGFLYGFDGRQEQGCILRCVEWETGKVRWSEDGLGAGSITVAHRRLLILTERGELIQADATPDGFKPAHRAQILGFQTRAYPALANGRFHARDKTTLVCVDLRDQR